MVVYSENNIKFIDQLQSQAISPLYCTLLAGGYTITPFLYFF